MLTTYSLSFWLYCDCSVNWYERPPLLGPACWVYVYMYCSFRADSPAWPDSLSLQLPVTLCASLDVLLSQITRVIGLPRIGFISSSVLITE